MKSFTGYFCMYSEDWVHDLAELLSLWACATWFVHMTDAVISQSKVPLEFYNLTIHIICTDVASWRL